MLVADTNLIAYLLIPGEHMQEARQVRQKDAMWHSPPLWRSEFLSILALAVRLGQLSLDAAVSAAGKAFDAAIVSEKEPAPGNVLRIASEGPCSAYDAQFVALAMELDVPLVTSDKKLIRVFPNTATHPSDFVATHRDGESRD